MLFNVRKNKPFHLTVISPDETLFEDDVYAISAHNKKGPFDILSYHTNFVSIIDGSIKIQGQTGQKNIVIGTGILKAYENTVYIFVGLESEEGLPSQLQTKKH